MDQRLIRAEGMLKNRFRVFLEFPLRPRLEAPTFGCGKKLFRYPRDGAAHG
jgi:hypothetical protein